MLNAIVHEYRSYATARMIAVIWTEVCWYSHTGVHSPFSIRQTRHASLGFEQRSYFVPKIISASGAPLGGTYLGFFSRFRFKIVVGAAARLVTFCIKSAIRKDAFDGWNRLLGQTLFILLLFHTCGHVQGENFQSSLLFAISLKKTNTALRGNFIRRRNSIPVHVLLIATPFLMYWERPYRETRLANASFFENWRRDLRVVCYSFWASLRS